MKLTTILLSLSTICLLSACGTAPVIYKAPALQEASLSKITLTNPTSIPVGILVYKDAMKCEGPEALSAQSGVLPGQPQIITVEKNKPFSIHSIWIPRGSISVSAPTTVCYFSFTFTPTDAQHSIALRFDGKTCGVSQPTSAAIAPLVKREYQVPFSGSGPWCKALAVDEAKALQTK